MRFLKLIVSVILIITLSACGTSPIVNIDNSKYLQKNEDINQIEAAIKLGALKKGWRTEKVNSNLLKSTINVKEKYLVEVLISYSEKGYKISYKDSKNLKYNSSNKTIHNNYNRWINGLSKSINKALINVGSYIPNKIDLHGKKVYLKPNTSYKNDEFILPVIRDNCSIDKEIVNNIVNNTKSSGINIVVTEEIPHNALELKITVDKASEIESGASFRRAILFSGKILKNNIEYTSFTASRTSVAGAWNNNESLSKVQASCNIFSYINKNISHDISSWLFYPVDKMVLGDGKYK